MTEPDSQTCKCEGRGATFVEASWAGGWAAAMGRPRGLCSLSRGELLLLAFLACALPWRGPGVVPVAGQLSDPIAHDDNVLEGSTNKFLQRSASADSEPQA